VGGDDLEPNERSGNPALKQKRRIESGAPGGEEGIDDLLDLSSTSSSDEESRPPSYPATVEANQLRADLANISGRLSYWIR
jgi:hypothetical protein